MKQVVFICLLLTIAGKAVVGSGETLSSVLVESGRITVTVPIEIVGASNELLARWHEGIDRRWNLGNDGQPFQVCGRAVYFDVQFMAQTARAAAGHIVFVEPVKPGQRYVSSVWHALGTAPTESPRTGFWGNNLKPGTAAHEFGHLLGLLDEYTEEDVNGNGLRDPGEGSVPDVRRYPRDAWLSLMANERGVVLQRHIREVLRLHGAHDTLTCSR